MNKPASLPLMPNGTVLAHHTPRPTAGRIFERRLGAAADVGLLGTYSNAPTRCSLD